jgi:hypothetical protein
VLTGGLCAALVHQVFVSGRATSITGVEWLRYGLLMVVLVVIGARWVRARRTLMRWLREVSGGGAPPAA